MRYLIIISLSILFGACNKLNKVKVAGEKVAKTINACTEAAKNVCNEDKTSAVNNETKMQEEGEDTKASISWDTRMMLW